MITSFNYRIIPHHQQAYNTIGNYWEDPPGSGHWEIRVSDVGSWQMALLVCIHEIIELAQTENDGIPEPAISAFDKKFEASNPPPDSEPGDQIDAPYHRQHVMAENLERQLAWALKINWNEYDSHLMSIWRGAQAAEVETPSTLSTETTTGTFCPPAADVLRGTIESLPG